jgi:hypothetical protein
MECFPVFRPVCNDANIYIYIVLLLKLDLLSKKKLENKLQITNKITRDLLLEKHGEIDQNW